MRVSSTFYPYSLTYFRDWFCTSCRALKAKVKYRGIEGLKGVPVCDFCLEVYNTNPEIFTTDRWVTDKSWLKDRQVVIKKFCEVKEADVS